MHAIQGDTEGAVLAMGEIGQIIQQINSFQSSIAAAVEQQSATTDTIGAGIRQSLDVTTEIAEAISALAVSARSGAEELSSTRDRAVRLGAVGDRLKQTVASFTV